MREPFEGLPDWVAALAWRLTFSARGVPGARRRRRALRRTLRALRPRLAEPSGAQAAMDAFCRASLALAEAVVDSRTDLVAARPVFARLCALARAELAGARDDRPLLAAVAALEGTPEAPPWGVTQVPGRVVFLAAMASSIPAAEGEAATMLANDLAALGCDLPGAALDVAAGLRAVR
ncbi:MAG TPA: hypothetical protein VN329_16310 [Roseomonas sp.]|nr:hypothetical protein [Roseomonas sp.]